MTKPATLDLLSPAARSFVAKEKRLYIGGAWVPAASGETFETIDPATELPFDRVPLGAPVDVDRAVAAARSAIEEGPWARMTPGDRSKLVWRLGDLIEQHADEIAEIEAIDNGKPWAQARFGDIAFSHELFHYMAGWCTKINGETITLSSAAPFHAYTLRSPVGVCGQIVPWNFSFMMAAWKVAPALASGCAIVLKPAKQTPLTALRLAELVEEAGFPKGVFNVVTGYGDTVGTALAAHPGVDKVAFTGSTEVGRKIMAAAQGNIKKVSLELGGKSPMVVFADADLDLAVKAVASGIFYNMGQVCTAGTRLYVEDGVADAVIDGLIHEAKSLKIGPGPDRETQFGPLVSAEQFARVAGYVAKGLAEGAKLATGGERVGNRGYFLAPTILADTKPEMTVVREEIFGPVLCVARFREEEAAVREANNSIYGLAGSVFTRDLSRGLRVAARLKGGTIGVNTHHVIDPALPFGGFKQSGWGREMGREAIELYTEVKSIGVAL
jgi:phenylacetaldehyde dehydrogenase